MKDFIYYAPTEVVFGVHSEDTVDKMIKKYGGKKVMVHYGGQSAIKSGLLDKICNLLRDADIDFIKLGGVVPNPRLSKVYEGINLCSENNIDFILAIGGGSVIDSAKAIGLGVANPDIDIWDIFLGKAKPSSTIPTGCVLTIPAAGSEMSKSTVITNEDGDYKLGYGNDLIRPKFAIMNPERTYSLPPYQTAAGVTDMMMHVMERYFTKDDDMDLTSDLAETLMRSIKNSVFEVLKDPENYRYRAQIMWAGSLAHNGLAGCGVTEDWATHKLEHELSGMFDVTHGAGLAAIWPSWARYVMHENLSRFVRYAVNVMGVPNDFSNPETTALKGIEATERFFKAMDMPISIFELIGKEITDDEIKEMAKKCSQNRTITCGQLKVLDYDDMIAIYQMAKKPQ